MGGSERGIVKTNLPSLCESIGVTEIRKGDEGLVALERMWH
jgi:hypothetical protein